MNLAKKPLMLFLLGCATEGASAADGRLYPPPPLGDTYLSWSLYRMDIMRSDDDFASDEAMVETYLADPSSIYTNLVVPFGVGTAQPSQPTQQGWRILRDDMLRKRRSPTDASDHALEYQIAWDLGFTKAIPGSQTPRHAATPGHIYAHNAASIYKSGLDYDLWERSVNMADPGGNLTTLGVELAVSVQILKGWVDSTDVLEQKRLGIDAGVLERFHAASSFVWISDADLAYLASILRSELSIWRAGRSNLYGIRELPTPLRIARGVMAHWEQTHPPTGMPCLPDGSVDLARAGTSPEDLSKAICTTEATDRAVYRRYRKLREYQVHLTRDKFVGPDNAERLIRFFGPIKPAWAGTFRDEALDYSAHAEVVEAQMAVEADPTEESDVRFWRLVERANLLICRSSVR